MRGKRRRGGMTVRPLRRPARTCLTALAAAWVVTAGSTPIATAEFAQAAVAGGAAPPAAASTRPADSGSWTVYHHDPAGTGVAAPVTAVDTARRAWTSP